MVLVLFAGPVFGATRDEIIKRGFLQCGVSTGLPGFSEPDQNGEWRGLDAEICRAVAAATLGDATKVKFFPLTPRERFIALQTGEVDLLARNTTWTFTRDSSLGLNFAGISYFDGQGFLVPRSLDVASALELDGVSVCIKSATTTERNLADYFHQHGMEYKPVIFDTSDQTVKGFESGRCQVITSDQSQLYGLRLKLSKPEEVLVLPEVISKEPLGPVVRQGDDAWNNIVRWTLYAMINAEELGVTSANIDEMQQSGDPSVRRLLGLEGIKGEGLGLDEQWAYRIVSQVGNYGEVFRRTVGAGSPLQISRGLNALWKNGGLQYAPPML